MSVAKVETLKQGVFIERFAPQFVEELAIHPKKILEVEEWLKYWNTNDKILKLCLLSGPTGCGKMATIRVICKKYNYNIHEWLNPVSHETIVCDYESKPSHIDAFKNFLFAASRYGSVLNFNKKRILLVKDMPHVLLKNTSMLVEILKEYEYYGTSPLLLIVTDIKSFNINSNHYAIITQLKEKIILKHITFNPIASTLMQKAMKRFLCMLKNEEHYTDFKQPSPEIFESILVSARGDIRNALINLYYSTIKGAPNVKIKTNLYETEKQSKKMKYTLISIGTDEFITNMHVMGRIFHPKYLENGRFLHYPEDITDYLINDARKIIDLLHGNYLQRYKEIEHIKDTCDDFSLLDLWMEKYFDTSLAILSLNLIVRSLMVTNKNPVNCQLENKSRPLIKERKLQYVQYNQYSFEYRSLLRIIYAKQNK